MTNQSIQTTVDAAVMWLKEESQVIRLEGLEGLESVIDGILVQLGSWLKQHQTSLSEVEAHLERDVRSFLKENLTEMLRLQGRTG